jgi:hypothetical protein
VTLRRPIEDCAFPPVIASLGFAPDDPGTDWNDLARSQGAAPSDSNGKQAMAIAGRGCDAEVIAAARDEVIKAKPEGEEHQDFRVTCSR